MFGDQNFFAVFDRETPGLMSDEDGDAFAFKTPVDDFGYFRVFAIEDARCHFYLRDLCAEASEGLRQFRTNRAAAEDEQPLWQVTEIPDGVGGQVAHRFNSGNRRDKGACAGGDDDAARAQAATGAVRVGDVDFPR